MATLEFELKDSNGVDTDIGDIIEVVYPEVEIFDAHQDEISFYRPETTAVAKVYCPPSKGLRLKILEIKKEVWIDDCLKSDFQHNVYRVGQITDFSRTVWQWHKIAKWEAANEQADS